MAVQTDPRRRYLKLESNGHARPRVIAGLSHWTLTGPCVLTARLVRQLSKAGWDARILLTETGSGNVTWQPTPLERPADVQFDRLPAAYHDSWGMRWNALIRYLEERAPCIYLMSTDWRNNVVASRLSNGVRVIGCVHADTDLEYEQAARLGRHWNAIVAVNDPLHFKLAHRMPGLASRLVTIRTGVPVPPEMPQRRSPGRLRIAYAGELRASQKRLGDVVQIAHRLHERGTPFELTFIGDGPLRQDVEHRTRRLLAAGKVRFTGSLESDAVLHELAEHDVLLLTSDFEGPSLALLEAMSRGCVPVVTGLAEHSFLIEDGHNGFLVTVGDIEQFAHRLDRLAHDVDQRTAMGHAAFATIVKGGYQLETMVGAYVRLFDRVDGAANARAFVRPRGPLLPPPESVNGIPVLPGTYEGETDCVNEDPAWPNSAPVETRSASREPVSASRARGRPLSEYRLLISSPFGEISGVDVFCGHLLSGLRRRGVDARIVDSAPVDLSRRLGLDSSVPVEHPIPRSNMTWPARWRCMVDYLEVQAPCIYIPNYDREHASVIPLLSDQVKVLTIVHSDDPAHYDLVMRVGPASNAIVGVSEAIVAHVRKLSPQLGGRAEMIPYGVSVTEDSTELLQRRDDVLRILYVGRLTAYQKRVLDLIEVARLIRNRGVRFELTVVGDGPAREDFLSLGRELLLSRQLRYIGTVPNTELPALYRTSDVLLMPSAFEGLSVAMLEAMAAGVVPVVSGIRSGVPDVIRPGCNGLVAPIGDVVTFADHLSYLCEHPDVRRAMGESARRTVIQQYRVETMVDKYVNLLEAIAADSFRRTRGRVAPPDWLAGELRWKTRVRRWLGVHIRSATGRRGP